MNLLRTHFKAMQVLCAAYVCPEPYTDLAGESACDHNGRDRLFAGDMIYMLDGPEQRLAQNGISPQIRFAVERALERAKKQYAAEQATMAELCMVTLQGQAWADECESLEAAIETLKGLE